MKQDVAVLRSLAPDSATETQLESCKAQAKQRMEERLFKEREAALSRRRREPSHCRPA